MKTQAERRSVGVGTAGTPPRETVEGGAKAHAGLLGRWGGGGSGHVIWLTAVWELPVKRWGV